MNQSTHGRQKTRQFIKSKMKIQGCLCFFTCKSLSQINYSTQNSQTKKKKKEEGYTPGFTLQSSLLFTPFKATNETVSDVENETKREKEKVIQYFKPFDATTIQSNKTRPDLHHENKIKNKK